MTDDEMITRMEVTYVDGLGNKHILKPKKGMYDFDGRVILVIPGSNEGWYWFGKDQWRELKEKGTFADLTRQMTYNIT